MHTMCLFIRNTGTGRHVSTTRGSGRLNISYKYAETKSNWALPWRTASCTEPRCCETLIHRLPPQIAIDAPIPGALKEKCKTHEQVHESQLLTLKRVSPMHTDQGGQHSARYEKARDPCEDRKSTRLNS